MIETWEVRFVVLYTNISHGHSSLHAQATNAEAFERQLSCVLLDNTPSIYHFVLYDNRVRKKWIGNVHCGAGKAGVADVTSSHVLSLFKLP